MLRLAPALAAIALGSCDVVVPDVAAPRSFMKVIGGAMDDEGFALRQTADGGYILAGTTRSLGSGGSDMYLVKTSAGGDVEWSRAYGGALDDGARDVLQLDDGGYLVVGSTLSFGAQSEDVYVVRTRPSGDTLWTRMLGTGGIDQGNAVIAAHGGGVLIGGRSNGATGTYEHYLIRLGSDGDSLWTRRVIGTESAQTNALARLADGYLLAGSFGSLYHVLHVDTAGRLLSERRDVSMQAELHAIVPIDSKTFHVIGRQRRGAEANDSVLVMRVTAERGTPIPSPSPTARRFGRTGGSVGYAGALASDGGLVVLGGTRGFGRLNDLYLLETDTSGALRWSQGYGGAFDDVGRAMIVARDGGIVVLGTAASFVDSHNGRDLILMKLDAEGRLRE